MLARAISAHRFRRRPRSASQENPRPARHSPHRRRHHQHHQGRSRSASALKPGGRGHSPHPDEGPDEEVLKRVLRYLTLKEILGLRMISKDWNEFICDDDCGLWSKGRLYFDATAKPPPDSSSNKEKTKALTSRFVKFTKNSLVTEFNCPSFHFYSLDVRFDIVRKFFLDHGKFIRNLRLNNCIMSLVAFQRILKACHRLEVFEITGMFHCMTHSESLFASKTESSLRGFINIRKLTFESTYVSRLAQQTIRNAKRGGRGAVQFVDSLEVQDLHPTVVREILMSATKLESLTFSGFGIATVNRVLHNLSHYPFQHNLVQLEFLDIPDSSSPSCLSEMDDLSHLQLRKFAMTFLGRGASRNVVLDEETGGGLQGNLDGVLRKLLLAHQCTLETLDLTNCSVTEAIFLPSERLNQVPALRTLCLQGTLINELSENAKYVLRSYLTASSGVQDEDGTNGPMPRTLIDEILEAALEDERTNSEGSGGNGGGCSNGVGGNGTKASNGCSFENMFDAFVFAIGMVGVYFVCLYSFGGESTGPIVFYLFATSVIILLAIYKVVVNSLSD